MQAEITWTVVAAFSGGLSGVASLSWWLASKFNNVYRQQNEMEKRLLDRIIGTKDLVVNKIDAHEKLDNERFQNQNLAIMRIEMLMQSSGMNPLQVPSPKI